MLHPGIPVFFIKISVSIICFLKQDRSIAVWDMTSPTEITLRRVLVGHRAAVNVVDFDEKYIVSASGDRTIKVWNTSSCEFLRTLNGHKRGIACLQYRDRLVVSGSSDNTIRYDVIAVYTLSSVPLSFSFSLFTDYGTLNAVPVYVYLKDTRSLYVAFVLIQNVL